MWKAYKEKLVTEEIRAEKIIEILKTRDIAPPPYRPRTKTDKELKKFHEDCESWVQSFLDDENKRSYLKKGIQWLNPTKNNWRWIEIQVLDEPLENLSSEEPVNPLPSPPEFGQVIKFSIDTTIEIGDHTEYLVCVKTNISHWYPYTHYYVLRRFSEFKQLHKKLKDFLSEEYFDIGIPEFPEKKVFGRMSKSTIEKRIKSFQELLNFVANDQRLNSCEVLFEFFAINPSFNSWKYINYVIPTYSHQ